MDNAAKIARAKAIADEIRHVWPAKAAEIDSLIEQIAAGKRDSVKVSLRTRFRLEKFHGDVEPGKRPYETIEGEG